MHAKTNRLPVVRELLLIGAFLFVIFSVNGKIFSHRTGSTQKAAQNSVLVFYKSVQPQTAQFRLAQRTLKLFNADLSTGCFDRFYNRALTEHLLSVAYRQYPVTALFIRSHNYYLFPRSGSEPPPLA